MIDEIDKKLINEIKYILACSSYKRQSPFIKSCLSAIPILFTLFKEQLRIDFKNCEWEFKDKLIICEGEKSLALYTIMTYFNYGYKIDDLGDTQSKKIMNFPIKNNFGIDFTTSLFGQGIANAVGMAINSIRQDSYLFQNEIEKYKRYIYCITDEKSLNEGITYEACSLAGLLNLDNLIILYDNNKNSLEDDFSNSFCEDVFERFNSINFATFEVIDGNNPIEISSAIDFAKESKKPSLIKINSQINDDLKNIDKTGYNFILNQDDLHIIKCNLKVDNIDFDFTQNAYLKAKDFIEIRQRFINEKQKQIASFIKQNKEKFSRNVEDYKNEIIKTLSNFQINFQMPILKFNQQILNAIGKIDNNLVGGNSNLAPLSLCFMDNDYFSSSNRLGSNIHFGNREFAMGAICNGYSSFNNSPIFCVTELIYSDYLKSAIRHATFLKNKVLFIFIHENSFNGEITQTIEQLEALQNIPNFEVFKPYDQVELLASYKYFFEHDGPMAIILNKNVITKNEGNMKLSGEGGYEYRKCPLKEHEITIVSSGYEIELCLRASEILKNMDIGASVVSCINEKLFYENNKNNLKNIFKKAPVKVFIQNSNTNIFDKYLGKFDIKITINDLNTNDNFKLLKDSQLNVEKIVQKTEEAIKKYRKSTPYLF